MPQEHELTTEFTRADASEFNEHSSFSRSKKVIPGPTFIPKHDVENRTADPIQVALTSASANISGLKKGAAYRLIASRAMHFRMHAGVGVALDTDVYVGANQAIIVSTGSGYNTISVIKSVGEADGIAQAVEVK